MEDAKSKTQYDEQEEFYEALDDFPFYDCEESFSDLIESNGIVSTTIEDKTLPPASLRRRRSPSHYKPSGANSMESSELSSSVISENYLNCRSTKTKLSHKFKEPEKKLVSPENSDSVVLKHSSESKREIVSGENNSNNGGNSILTDANNCRGEDVVRNESYLGENQENHEADSSLLVFLAGMTIKAISFQFDMLVRFFTFPIWLIYNLYMLVFDPFGFLKRGRNCLIRKMKRIWNLMLENVSPFVYEWFKEHKAIWKLGLKCGWGLLWSGYVCAVLVGFLVTSFVIGGLLIKSVVEEPIKMKRSLNFDYTEKSPLAFVPIIASPELSHDVHLGEKPEIGKSGGSRVIPLNHKLLITVALTLPESDYNQNLGIFQVRVDFLAADGRTLASTRRPCMLQFRSQPIRLLLTFLKVAPILTGYTSEAQDLKIYFRGFVEGGIPTACLRVVIEQRAEFLPGAGIPEIYASSLTLESELPLLKKVIWWWKKSLFVWISMIIFTMELLFALLCCKPIIIPKIRLREESMNEGAPQIDRPAQT